MRPILYYHTCHQYNKCSNENMQIVLFAETKFSKEIVVMIVSQNFKDSASYTLLLYPDSIYFQTFTFRYSTQYVKPLLHYNFFGNFQPNVVVCWWILPFCLSFFFRIHILSGNPTTTVKCEAGYRSPANSFFFCCLYFLTNSISVLATTHLPVIHAKNESKPIFAEIFFLKATVHCRESPLKKMNSH